MTDPTCLRCARPVADQAYICSPCTMGLMKALHQASELAGELLVTIARLDRLGEGGRSSAETSLPFDWDAADSAWCVANTLGTWARHCAEERGRLVGDDIAAWLGEQLEWLRHRPEADQAWDELHDACALLRRTVDAPTPRWYAGRCGSGHDLYAAPQASVVRCRECGEEYDADERKAWLLEQALDHLAHAFEIAGLVSQYRRGDDPVTAAMIRGLAFRGRFTAHGHDAFGRPLYRVGDVIEVLAHTTRRERVMA